MQQEVQELQRRSEVDAKEAASKHSIVEQALQSSKAALAESR